jgi:hypothetical protein
LVESGWGATRKKDCLFKRKFASMVTRKGKKKALMTIGHKIIIAAYFVIKNKEKYKEPLLNDNPKRKNKQVKNYLAKLKELGIEVEVKNVA